MTASITRHPKNSGTGGEAPLRESNFAVWRGRIFVLLLWIALWEVLYLCINNDIYFPSPLATVKAILALIWMKKTWLIIGMSSYRTLMALVSSAIVGVALGIACGLNRRLYDFFNPLVVVLKSTPVVSVIIIAIIWFRSADVPNFSGFLMCFPIVFSGTVAGIRNTDPKLKEMCSFYGVRRYDVLSGLYFRASLPYINAAVISSIGICWKAVAAAEVLSMPPDSIGANLYYAKTALDPASLLAWTFIIIVLSFLLETLYAKVSGYDKT